MTATVNTTYDVFISHAVTDSHLATEIAESLASVGLETFHSGTVPPGSDLGEVIWQALAESRALIAIISPDVPRNAMGMVEIGAAAAWNKPVFLLINGPSTMQLPPALHTYPAFPLGRLDEVIQAIQTGFDALTDDERNVLVEVYRDLKTPVDQLSQSPLVLRQLTTQFNERAIKQFSGERLLWELLRMRKGGHLPRLRSRNQHVERD